VKTEKKCKCLTRPILRYYAWIYHESWLNPRQFDEKKLVIWSSKTVRKNALNTYEVTNQLKILNIIKSEGSGLPHLIQPFNAGQLNLSWGADDLGKFCLLAGNVKFKT
jgi:hypothetical protein